MFTGDSFDAEAAVDGDTETSCESRPQHQTVQVIVFFPMPAKQSQKRVFGEAVKNPTDPTEPGPWNE